ncbi:MAG: potassium transporter TrkG, partial [Sulfolobales archaeon]|nr:potassium transporter TrkG [Sulfolobales archaeon]
AIVMTLGALNFMDLYNLTRGRLRDFAESIEVRGFAAILSTFLVALGAISIATSSVESFWVWSFHVLSGFTTTGFSLAPISEHPDVVKVVIILSMVIGGATFSTAGGIKIKRAIVTAKLVFWETSKTFIPKSVVVVRKVGGEVIRDEDVSSIYSFVALYGLTLVATSIALHLSLLTSGIASYSYVDSLLETSSALSCVGLSSGIASSSAPALTKAILMIAMYLGRIEFLPLYTIIGAYYMSKITL